MGQFAFIPCDFYAPNQSVEDIEWFITFAADACEGFALPNLVDFWKGKTRTIDAKDVETFRKKCYRKPYDILIYNVMMRHLDGIQFQTSEPSMLDDHKQKKLILQVAGTVNFSRNFGYFPIYWEGVEPLSMQSESVGAPEYVWRYLRYAPSDTPEMDGEEMDGESIRNTTF